MKIQVLTDNLQVPSLPAFFTGKTYEVDDALANQLIERMQAVQVKEEPKQEPEKPNKKGTREVSN